MLKIYICRSCGNIIEMIEDSSVIPECCGEEMEELRPGTTDGTKEKHIPVITNTEDLTCSDPSTPCMKLITIQTGELPHPMTTSHHIAWICIVTNEGIYRKDISSCDTPEACFCLKKEEQVKAIYSYCNLHGLWMNTMK